MNTLNVDSTVVEMNNNTEETVAGRHRANLKKRTSKSAIIDCLMWAFLGIALLGFVAIMVILAMLIAKNQEMINEMEILKRTGISFVKEITATVPPTAEQKRCYSRYCGKRLQPDFANYTKWKGQQDFANSTKRRDRFY